MSFGDEDFCTTADGDRLKTQASFVQNSEDNLRKQEEHCKLEHSISENVWLTQVDEKVMQAFQSAMSLLSRPS